MPRKLSDIIIEMALQGFKDENYRHSDLMHALVFLAHVAWNRDTVSPDYLADEYHNHLNEFEFPKKKIRKELITEDWEEILRVMLEHKRKNFPEDGRVITLCAYTPRGTFRVEWK